jgi:hypothetical protein
MTSHKNTLARRVATKERRMAEFLERALNIVKKEPDYISSSQSTRKGYARATRDMESALINEFKLNIEAE